MQFELLAAAWIPDAVFFAILALGLLIGLIRGFVKSVCKLAGTIVSIFIAFTFCNAFKNTLENWFGLTTALANAFGGTEAAVKAASWVSIAIAFVALVIVVKLLSWLTGKIGTALIERSPVFLKINRVLGAIFGLAEGVILIFLLLTVCYWIPSESLHELLGNSTVVGAIFRWETFQWAAEFQFLG